MTLRKISDKSEVEQENEQGIFDTLRIEKFTQVLEDVKTYLTTENFGGQYKGGWIKFGVPIIIVSTISKEKPFLEAYFNEMEYTMYYRSDDNEKRDLRDKFLDESENRHLKTAWWSAHIEKDCKDVQRLKFETIR